MPLGLGDPLRRPGAALRWPDAQQPLQGFTGGQVLLQRQAKPCGCISVDLAAFLQRLRGTAQHVDTLQARQLGRPGDQVAESVAMLGGHESHSQEFSKTFASLNIPSQRKLALARAVTEGRAGLINTSSKGD